MSDYQSYSTFPQQDTAQTPNSTSTPPELPPQQPQFRQPQFQQPQQAYSQPMPPAPSPVHPFHWLGGCAGCGCVGFAALFLLVILGVIGLVIQAGKMFDEDTTAKRVFVSGNEDATDTTPRVAILKIEETISETEGFINDQIKDVMKDDSVKAIVLRMDTPGGTVSASDLFYHKLTKLREEKKIPIVVSMGGMCASGGYYIAMSVGTENKDVIFAEPTTWTGSIGVILSAYNLAKLAEKVGIEENSLKSHELKGMGGLFRPMTDQERQILQALVDDAFGRFKEVVYSGRKVYADDHAKLDAIATGQVYTTSTALENGLVDKQGYLTDAVKRALELAGLNEKDTEVYTYKKLETLGSLLSATHEKMDENMTTTVQDLLSPRACYLWTVGQ